MLRVHFLHFYCYGMRSVMLQINEYDDDDNVKPLHFQCRNPFTSVNYYFKKDL